MATHRLPCALLLLGAALVRGSSVLAEPGTSPASEAHPTISPAGETGTFSFTFENDIFAGTDRYYTSGVRLAWVSSDEPCEWLATLGHRVARSVMPEARVAWSLAVGQSMYTARNVSSRNPPRDDRPFAGWLYATGGLSSASEADLSTVEVSLGVIGPSARAHEAQDFAHYLTNGDKYEGWNRQIDDRPAVLITLVRSWALQWAALEGFAADVVPAVGANLGNVQTSAAVGMIARFGHHLEVDFGPPRIRPALAGNGVFRSPNGKWAFYAFVGAEGRAIAYDQTIDGNDDGYWRVDREPLVGEVSGGAELVYRAVRASFAMIVQSATFEQQSHTPFVFGSLQLSTAF